MVKSVAVIGAGVSGLLSAKAAKEAGLVPTIFEASGYIGGIWSPGSTHIPQSLITNVSKYICTFSDFPWDTDPSKPQIPMFPSAQHVGEYLNNYAKHFLNEQNCVRMHTKVTEVDFKVEKGQWLVKYETALGGHIDHPLPNKQGEDYYDFLIIASGFFSKAFIPSIPGISTKNCQVYHYSRAEILLSRGHLDLSGKSVTVIGGSLSGVELAGSLCRHSPRRVIHVMKKPLWILPLYLPDDPDSPCPSILPLDLVLMGKIPDLTQTSSSKHVPTVAENNRKRNTQLRKFAGDQGLISPHLKISDDATAYIGVSETYAEFVRSGSIEVVIGELDEINGSALKIRHQEANGEIIETEIPHVDTVIVFATGFSTQLSFLSKELLESINFDEKDLFQPLLLGSSILNPKLPQAAFVGMYRGPYFTVVEMQARYAASLFSGALSWPTVSEQLADIAIAEKIRFQFPRQQFPYPNYIDSVKAHVNLGKIYERADEEFAIAPRYSSSSEASSILQSFHADLKKMREGRYVPLAVYRNLAGTWEFRGQSSTADAYPDPECASFDLAKVLQANVGRQMFAGKNSQAKCHLPSSEVQDFEEFYAYFEGAEDEDQDESYVYNDCLETLFVEKYGGREAITFVRDLGTGWKGSTKITGYDGTKYEFDFVFPFNGIYISTFSKRLVTTRPNDGAIEDTTKNYYRKLSNH